MTVLVLLIPLLALGASAVAFRGSPPTWVMTLAAVCLGALLIMVACGIIFGLVEWRGSELVLPVALAAFLTASLVHVLRLLAQLERA